MAPRLIRVSAPASRALAIIAAAALLAGCGIGAPSAPIATPVPSPLASVTSGIEVTAGLVEAALKLGGVGLIRPQSPAAPPESPELQGHLGASYEAIVAGQPTGGAIAIYELPDPSAAYAAGLAQATWLGSGPGAVQFVPGTKHLVRLVGNTLVTYSWSPPTEGDPAEQQVAELLLTVGREIPVPSI